MIKIVKATVKDTQLLSKIGKTTFFASHGHSAPKEDIDTYIAKTFNENNCYKELENPSNFYFLLYVDDKIAGFTKIVLDAEIACITSKNNTLLSKLYLLEEFYGLNLGQKLFNFNVNLSKQHQQKGIWLAVWVENKRALSFYKKMGFLKVGHYNFKISETHTNPNHILYLAF